MARIQLNWIILVKCIFIWFVVNIFIHTNIFSLPLFIVFSFIQKAFYNNLSFTSNKGRIVWMLKCNYNSYLIYKLCLCGDCMICWCCITVYFEQFFFISICQNMYEFGNTEKWYLKAIVSSISIHMCSYICKNGFSEIKWKLPLCRVDFSD